MDDATDERNVRPVAEVVAEMNAIADRCEADHVPAAEAAAMADRTLSLILELRVPRMPDTAEELAEMLADSEDGPTYSSEEVFEHLARRSAVFSGFLGRYRAAIAEGRIEDAARMLGPDASDGSPEWLGPPAQVTADQDGMATRVTITRDGRSQECVSRDAALATLGAVLRCHASWDDIRRR